MNVQGESDGPLAAGAGRGGGTWVPARVWLPVRCRGHLLPFIVVLVASAVVAGCARHRPPVTGRTSYPPGWSAVQQLPSGQSVRLDLRDGTTVTGRFVSADEGSLVVRQKGRDARVVRGSIQRVTRRDRQTKRKAMRGLLIGGVAGAVVGAAATDYNRGAWSAMLGLGWAALGCAIGASDGFFDRSNTVVYQAH